MGDGTGTRPRDDVRGRVFAGYVDRRRGAGAPARDAVLVRSQAAAPTIVGQWRLGEVDGCLFEGRDVDVTPFANGLTPAPAAAGGSMPGDLQRDGGLVVGYMVAGSMRVVQEVGGGSRSTVLHRGDLVLYDGVTRSGLRATDSHRYFVAYVRGPSLRIRREDRDALVARDLSSFAGARALAALLASVVADAGDPPPNAGHHLGDAIVACVHAIIAEARGTPTGDRAMLLYDELARWLDEHLAEPGLSADVLAARFYLSARYVRKLFAAHGVTVTGYIRLRRLERIRDELLEPAAGDVPVSAIAARWGFNDASVFSRAFTRQFGQGPQRFRRDAMGRRPDR